jgi:hypothetical protein
MTSLVGQELYGWVELTPLSRFRFRIYIFCKLHLEIYCSNCQMHFLESITLM